MVLLGIFFENKTSHCATRYTVWSTQQRTASTFTLAVNLVMLVHTELDVSVSHKHTGCLYRIGTPLHYHCRFNIPARSSQ